MWPSQIDYRARRPPWSHCVLVCRARDKHYRVRRRRRRRAVNSRALTLLAVARFGGGVARVPACLSCRTRVPDSALQDCTGSRRRDRPLTSRATQWRSALDGRAVGDIVPVPHRVSRPLKWPRTSWKRH